MTRLTELKPPRQRAWWLKLRVITKLAGPATSENHTSLVYHWKNWVNFPTKRPRPTTCCWYLTNRKADTNKPDARAALEPPRSLKSGEMPWRRRTILNSAHVIWNCIHQSYAYYIDDIYIYWIFIRDLVLSNPCDISDGSEITISQLVRWIHKGDPRREMEMEHDNTLENKTCAPCRCLSYTKIYFNIVLIKEQKKKVLMHPRLRLRKTWTAWLHQWSKAKSGQNPHSGRTRNLDCHLVDHLLILGSVMIFDTSIALSKWHNFGIDLSSWNARFFCATATQANWMLITCIWLYLAS